MVFQNSVKTEFLTDEELFRTFRSHLASVLPPKNAAFISGSQHGCLQDEPRGLQLHFESAFQKTKRLWEESTSCIMLIENIIAAVL